MTVPSKNHCCVIGGCGFIGHHVVELLARQKKAITVIGRNPHPTRKLPPKVRYIAGDYGNPKLLSETFKNVDQIIDLAYTSVPKTSFDNPVKDILGNLPASVNLLEVASLFPIKKIIIVSSGGTIYGNADNLPIREDHPTNPISPYGITKLAVEKYAMMYHKIKGLPIVCVRPGNAFGEGQKPFVGQGFVATAIGSILEKREINIFGGHGTIRDFIYVKDLASAIVAALNCPSGECYNIGTGIGQSNQAIIEMLASITKSKDILSQIKILPARKFDVAVNILDSSKLHKETGWTPKVSLEKGLKLTWEHFKKHHKA